MESTNLGWDMAGRFRAGRRGPATGAEATVLDSRWVGAVEVVRCLLVFLGGEVVWEGGSMSSWALSRRTAALRLREG